jgi:hypothetical protein
MMLSYNESNIIAVIKTSILAHEGIKNSFSSLSGCKNKDDSQLLLGYILERFWRDLPICREFFIKHLKGNSGNQIQKLGNSQATRTKVAHLAVNAKKIEVDKSMFVSDDMPECQALWEMVDDNIFELADG